MSLIMQTLALIRSSVYCSSFLKILDAHYNNIMYHTTNTSTHICKICPIRKLEIYGPESHKWEVELSVQPSISSPHRQLLQRSHTRVQVGGA